MFPSPSTAAMVLLGRSSNGRVEWKSSDGKTLKELAVRRRTRRARGVKESAQLAEVDFSGGPNGQVPPALAAP